MQNILKDGEPWEAVQGITLKEEGEATTQGEEVNEVLAETNPTEQACVVYGVMGMAEGTEDSLVIK